MPKKKDLVVKDSTPEQKVFGVRANSDILRRIKVLGAETDTKINKLVEEALIDLLKKYNKV